jgi:integrase
MPRASKLPAFMHLTGVTMLFSAGAVAMLSRRRRSTLPPAFCGPATDDAAPDCRTAGNASLKATAERPLKEATTVRRGKYAGKPLAKVRDDVRASFVKLGYERSLLYKTMLLMGLRLNEVRSLTVAQLDLVDPASLTLDPKAEKNREGNTLAIRDDLAADLCTWVADKLPTAKVFNVPKGLLRIFDRDLATAGIPKRGARGRTVSLHGLRHSFVTHLSRRESLRAPRRRARGIAPSP